MTIDARLTQYGASAITQLVETLHVARPLHDPMVATARTTNLGEMWVDQLVSLVEHRRNLRQPAHRGDQQLVIAV